MRSFLNRFTNRQAVTAPRADTESTAPVMNDKAAPPADLYPPDIPFDDGPCATCDAPCSSHAHTPDWLPIDMISPLAGTVKPYHRHAVFFWGIASSWDPHIDKDPNGLAAQLSAGAKEASQKLGTRILVSAAELPDPSVRPPWLDASFGTEETGVQVLLLPEMQLIGPVLKTDASSAILAYYTRQPLPAGVTQQDLHSTNNSAAASTSASPAEAESSSAVADKAGAGTAAVDSTAGGLGLPAFVLVCAHKRRDKRCGVVGPLLIDEFRREVVKQGLAGQVHTFGVSHIGGHAFAGNCIVYPDGTWYGRVKACNVHVIVERHILGHKVLKDLWRGRMQRADNSAW